MFCEEVCKYFYCEQLYSCAVYDMILLLLLHVLTRWRLEVPCYFIPSVSVPAACGSSVILM